MTISLTSLPQVAFNAESLEVPPLPWRLPPPRPPPPGESKKPLRVGVMAPYTLLEPSPAQARALLEAAGSPGLETVGIDINDLLPDLVTGALACYMVRYYSCCLVLLYPSHPTLPPRTVT